MPSALITGAFGSGGSYLAEYLVDNHPQLEVHGLARWHSTGSERNLSAIAHRVTVHECDLNDFSSVYHVLKTVRPEYIFHLASHANVRASFTTPLSVIENNVRGTANLLEALHTLEMNPVLQLCSTSEVYGQVPPELIPISEEAPLRPLNPYAVSKVTQDLLGQVYFQSYGLRVIRTRMFAYLNPRRRDLFATSFAWQVARIEAGLQEELRHGNLASVRTLIDVRDAMEAYWLASQRGRAGEVYNIGGTTSITVGGFLDVLRNLARTPIPARQDPALLRPTDVTLQVPDTRKFFEATGWQPRYTFQDSVAFLLDHCRREVARESGRGSSGDASTGETV